jgi:Nup93/Nic96
MLHSATADPFKLALYKLMGKLEPSRRSVPQVTTTTEDWLWFQLAMVDYFMFELRTTIDNLLQVDEDEDGGLRALAQVLLGYGERHFDGAPTQQGSRRGVWAGVLLMCGQFERVCGLAFLLSWVFTILSGRGGSMGASRHGSGSRTSCYRPCVSRFTSCPLACGNIRYDTA